VDEDLARRKKEAEIEGVLVWEAVYGVPPPRAGRAHSSAGPFGAGDGVRVVGSTGLQGLHQPSMVGGHEAAAAAHDETDPFNSGLRHMGAADVDLGSGWDLTLATGDAAHAAVQVVGD